MASNYKMTYNVDMVFCIDCTGSMDNIIDIVKNNALNFYQDVTNVMEKKHKHITQLRVRVVAFRDYRADGKDAMLVTNFFKLPQEAVDFEKCGIPIGAKLIFVEDESVIATVHDNRKVEYNNEITSLSAIASSIKGYRCAGPSFFTYNGKLVADVADETQWKDFN